MGNVCKILMHSRIIFTWKLTSDCPVRRRRALSRSRVIVEVKAEKEKPMETNFHVRVLASVDRTPSLKVNGAKPQVRVIAADTGLRRRWRKIRDSESEPCWERKSWNLDKKNQWRSCKRGGMKKTLGPGVSKRTNAATSVDCDVLILTLRSFLRIIFFLSNVVKKSFFRRLMWNLDFHLVHCMKSIGPTDRFVF